MRTSCCCWVWESSFPQLVLSSEIKSLFSYLLHLFSIIGLTFELGPLGQKISLWAFIGAISRSCAFKSRAELIFTSPFSTRLSQSFSRFVYALYDAFAALGIWVEAMAPIENMEAAEFFNNDLRDETESSTEFRLFGARALTAMKDESNMTSFAANACMVDKVE